MDSPPHVPGSIDQAISIQPSFDREDAHCWSRIAWTFLENQQTENAIECFRKVTQLNPAIVEAWANLGSLYRRLGNIESSVESFRHAVQLQPKNIGIVAAAAAAMRQAGQRDEARTLCESGLREEPDSSELLLLQGNILQEQDRFDAAIRSLEKAIELAGRTEQNVSCLGIACFRKGEIERAISLFRESILINPDFADGHFHLGMALLLIGDDLRGWDEYEWRPGGRRRPFPQSTLPLWNGRPLAVNQTLMLAAEQGFGDTIQFVRFAGEIKRRFGCQIILQAQRPLVSLLATCEGIDRVIERGEPLPKIDCYLPLASLPSVLHIQLDRSLPNVPYLKADPQSVAKWSLYFEASNMRGLTRKLRIGLSWQGDPKFPADRSRSVALKHFLPLLKTPDIEWISLQKGYGTEQLQTIDPNIEIMDFGDQLDSTGRAFYDSAAIMQHLDLMITSDTAIAHLAGALGIPVWIALNHVPDWRWNLERSDIRWYPTARLFRQPEFGDWVSVFSTMCDEMQRFRATRLR